MLCMEMPCDHLIVGFLCLLITHKPDTDLISRVMSKINDKIDGK